MFAVNFLSAIYLAVAMALSGEGIEALGFVQRHPYVILNILAFGLASAIGQVTFTPISVLFFPLIPSFPLPPCLSPPLSSSIPHLSLTLSDFLSVHRTSFSSPLPTSVHSPVPFSQLPENSSLFLALS